MSERQVGSPLEFVVHSLWFTVEVQTPLALPAWPGSALRGALLNALRRHYCPAPDDPDPGHSARCPVCWLMAREDPGWRWGRSPARPYAVALQADQHAVPRRYTPGDRFAFGVTLFGTAINLFPYLVLAVPEMGRAGLGRPLPENRGRRGTFRLLQVESVHLLTGARQRILDPDSMTVHTPRLAVNERDIQHLTAQLLDEIGPRGRLRVSFLTPTRIVHQKRLLKVPHFRPLFGRALDRIEALAMLYGETSSRVPGMQPVDDVREWLRMAEDVRLVDYQVQWVDIKSGSRRTGRVTPVGGFVGWAEYEAADWAPFLPVLLWAQVVHVGKDAVKGNGRIAVST